MVDFVAHPPHRPDPGKEDGMDTDDDTSSIRLTTQEFEFGLENGAFPDRTEFITVTRSRVPYTMRFPVSFFGDKSTDIAYMSKWVEIVLAEDAPVRPGSFRTAKLLSPVDVDKPEPKTVEYLLFDLYSEANVAAACKLGGGQGQETIYFETYTAASQAAEKGREIAIGSLAWNTTNTAVRGAMKKYGEVQTVHTTFNNKITMKEALVIFASATSVAKAKDERATCIVVGDDVGTITRLGYDN
ncbi:hypothetical protein BGW39_004593, partial [Mortierella sp. 14UC]